MSADQDDVIDLDAVSRSDHRMARMLRAVVSVMQFLMVFFAALLFIAAALTAFTSSFQNEFKDYAAISAETGRFFITLTFLIAGVVALSWFFVLRLLSKVVDTLIAGDPFVVSNISRLRLMWIVIAFTEVFRILMNFYASSEFSSDGDGWEIRIGTWFLVFVIATLAEAFRHGAKMRQEQELTI